MSSMTDGDEVEVMFTITVKKTLKREWCGGYGINPSDPDWAGKMALADAEAFKELQMTPDEFFMTDSCFDISFRIP